MSTDRPATGPMATAGPAASLDSARGKPAGPIWSPRYATPALIALLVALLPTIVNSYVGRKVVEGPAMTEALPETLDGQVSMPTDRKASSIRREFASEDWVERSYSLAGQGPVRILAVRSYDMKRLYHHPELAVTEREYKSAERVTLPAADGTMDIHVLRGMRAGMAAYALVYRGQTVANPYVFQIRVAPELLLTGQRPLTLVFAEDDAGDAEGDAAGLRAVRSVAAAVQALTR